MIPAIRATMPCTIQTMPMSRPMAALVRSRCRIITTPMTTSSRPATAIHARCCSSWSRARMKWKMPPRMSRIPMNTQITFNEVDGWKARAIPSPRVMSPTTSSICHTTLLGSPPCTTTTPLSDAMILFLSVPPLSLGTR
jgi:hypothetical protein